MKNWRKKIKNLFSYKRDRKTSREDNKLSNILKFGQDILGKYFTPGNTNSMMEKRADRLTSQHRRLPSVPHISKTQTSFKTMYGNSGDRMSENPQNTNRAVEQNSELVKQRPYDRKLLAFGASMSVKDRNNISHSDINSLKSKTDIGVDGAKVDKIHTTDAHTEDDRIFVPEILISHAENDEHCIVSDTPKQVFVCGDMDNALWHRLLVDLCREFSIRCTSFSDYPGCNRWLRKTDVFVFLMDEMSARAAPYKDQLRLAIMLDLDIVYVRDLGFELKKKENKRDFTHEDLKTDANESESNNLLHPNIPEEVTIKMSLESTVVDIETSEEVPSQHGKCVRDKTAIVEGRVSYGRREVDINKVIEIEYGTALVYHDLYHKKCLGRIISSIASYGRNLKSDTTSRAYSRNSLMSEAMSLANSRNSLMSEAMSLTNSRNSLHTPAFSIYSSVSNDSALGDMFHRMTPESDVPEVKEHLLLERSRSLDEVSFPSGYSSPTETVYLVSPNVGSENLKVFHWPADLDKDIVNSPSIDSFGFQDIDLSKRVNEIDLYEDYLSD